MESRGITDGVLVDYGLLSAIEVEAVESALDQVDERAVISIGCCVPDDQERVDDSPPGGVECGELVMDVPEAGERWRYHGGSWHRVEEGA